MKTIFSIAIALICFSSCQGQVSLANQFGQHEYICNGTNFEGVNLYATYNPYKREIKIYDVNHKVVKAIPYDTEESAYRIFVYGLSKDVFNSDNAIELIVHSFGSDGKAKFELINEDLTVIMEFESAYIKTIGNKNYIVESTIDVENSKSFQTDRLHLIEGKFRKIVY